MLVTEAQGYKLFCETQKIDFPPDTYYVRIFTKYEFAKNSDAEQTKIELFLTKSELDNLRQMLTV